MKLSLLIVPLLVAGVSAPTSAAEPAPSPLVPPPVPGGLTAEQVATRAAATSRRAEARDAEVTAATESLASARAGWLPRLWGGARYSRLSEIETPSLGTLVVAPGATPGPLPAGAPLVAVPFGFPTLENQYALTASLQIPVSDYVLRLPAVTEAAKRSARSAELVAKATRLDVAADARAAYYAWARARLQVAVAERSHAQALGHLQDARAAAEAGRASKADVLRVESQVASAELFVTRARSTAAVLEQRLRTLMHDESGQPYEIGEDLAADIGRVEIASEAALVREAFERRLEPRAVREGAEAARAQGRATLASGLPRLDLVGNAAYAQPNARVFPQREEFQGTWDVTVQLGWSPTDLVGARAGQKASAARARQLEAERQALLDGIRLEVREAAEALRQAEAAGKSAQRGLAAAEESYRVRRALFQNGRATSVELTDAETELARAQLEEIGARLDRRIAEVRMGHAVGRDVGEGEEKEKEEEEEKGRGGGG